MRDYNDQKKNGGCPKDGEVGRDKSYSLKLN